MKLRAGEYSLPTIAVSGAAIIGGGDQIIGQGGLELEAMHEIGMAPGAMPFSRACSCSILSSFQPMWGIFRSGSSGVIFTTSPAIQPRPGVTAELHPHRGQQLHADTDAQEWRALFQHLFAQRLHHAGHGAEAPHAIGEGAHAGQHDPFGVQDHFADRRW